jgi:hypothetical protein
VAALVRSVKALDAKRQDVLKRLAEARQRENNPRGEAFAEAKKLMDVAADEAGRLRLRGLLRTIIDGVYMLTVPRRSHRLCAVQINFAGGGSRHYLIHYHAAGYCREGGWDVRSFADAGPGPLDLRKPKDVAKVARLLESLELGTEGN